MSDEIDLAAEREEMDRRMALSTKRPVGPTATGRCLYCDEVVGDHLRWCGPECRDQWEALRNRRQ